MWIAIGVLLVLAALLLFLEMPALRRHPDRAHIQGRYIAHRGLHDQTPDTPENSLAAFRAAVERGYAIENDIHLTADGQVVVFHDDTLDRMCGVPGRPEEKTLAQRKELSLAGTAEKIPTLQECLDAVDGQVPLLVEMKCEDLGVHVCEKADELLKNYRGNYVMESFNPFALLWYRRHRPEICRGQLSMNFQRQEGTYDPQQLIARHLLTNFLSKPDFIAYDIRDKEALSKNICRKWFHCPSVAWTVRSAGELRKVKPYYDAFIFEGFRPQARK